MITISKNYDLIWHIDFANEYQFTKCKKLINTHRCIEVRKIVNGGSIGYCIRGKFYSLTYLRTHLQKITKQQIPF